MRGADPIPTRCAMFPQAEPILDEDAVGYAYANHQRCGAQREALVASPLTEHPCRRPVSRCPVPNPRRAAAVLVVACAVAMIAAVAWPAHAQARARWHERDLAHSGRMAVVFPAADALPNPRWTPGAINPAVNQDNLRQTICRRGGYTRSIRPPQDYTERLKRRQVRQYGYPEQMGRDGFMLRNYEEDHLISLELGGSPSDPRNLWPEPHHVVGGWGSYTKDRLEDRLHALVCRGRMPLTQAQRDIASDWIAAYKRYVGSTPYRRRRIH